MFLLFFIFFIKPTQKYNKSLQNSEAQNNLLIFINKKLSFFTIYISLLGMTYSRNLDSKKKKFMF